MRGHRRGGCGAADSSQGPLRRLKLGAAKHNILDGAALSAALAAAPLGLLEQLALPRCRLNDAVVRQLDDILVGTTCRLDLGLHVEEHDDVGDFPLLQPQLALLCQGGGWQANLHSLSLMEWSASPLSLGALGPWGLGDFTPPCPYISES